jgi:hypothetical protein
VVCVQLQQSQIRCNYFRRVAISVVSQLQSVTLFVAIRSRLVAARLGLVAIGSRRSCSSARSSCNWFALSCNWFASSCNWFGYEVATAGSVHLLYRMHLGAFVA